jgi:hypothetical protein
MKEQEVILSGKKISFEDGRVVTVGVEKDNPDSDFFLIFKRSVNEGDIELMEDKSHNVFSTPTAQVKVEENTVITKVRLYSESAEALHYLLGEVLMMQREEWLKNN